MYWTKRGPALFCYEQLEGFDQVEDEAFAFVGGVTVNVGRH